MKQEDFDENFKVLRYDSAEFARLSNVWYRNAMGFKRVSEVLLKQQEDDNQAIGQRIERVQKRVKSGYRGIPFEDVHPAFLHGSIALLIGLAIEVQLKAIVLAISKGKMELVTDEGLDERLTHHNIQQLIKQVNELRPNAIQARYKKDS